MSHPLISICIPAYNRPVELARLLESVSHQGWSGLEIIVSDDASPCEQGMQEVVGHYSSACVGSVVRYFRNPVTLGYDANLRHTIERATGEYCLFMGDDDVLCPNALREIAPRLEAHPRVGVVARAWRDVHHDTEEVVEEFRYFEGNRLFKPGRDAIVTFFRRTVFISGLVLHRGAALRYATAEFDGTLLYQVYLAASILTEMEGLYVAAVVAENRGGGQHYFGSSEPEKGRFRPGRLAPEHSLNFAEGMLRIAAAIEKRFSVDVFDGIVGDLANYSYPFLALHASNRYVFAKYAIRLALLGLGRKPLFWFYCAMLGVGGRTVCQRIVREVKRVRGKTPTFGRLYVGERLPS